MATLTTNELFRVLKPACFFKGQTTSFHGVADHSSQAAPGMVFFALPSKRRGPEGFIELALHKGATAVVAPDSVVLKKQSTFSHITFFGVKDIRLALAETAKMLFPEAPEFLAAVTGTNGKTSIAQITQQLWALTNHSAISLGTLGLQGMNYDHLPPSLTTPEPLDLYPLLDEAYHQGVTHCVLEASSHGLHQRRLDGLTFQVGCFSSFSQDHLDYHLNLRTYWLAKMRLFKELLKTGGTAIVNTSLPYPYDVSEACKKKNLTCWTYGLEEGDVKVKNVQHTREGQNVEAIFFDQSVSFFLPLQGRFQLENVLASILIVHASGVPLSDILAQIEHLKAVQGRLEYVGTTPKGGHVYVDYAHTPDALKVVLDSLRPQTQGNLWLVFGCGGDRDTGKRTQMGEIAAKGADHVIVTDDNPRLEDPEKIRGDVLKGVPQAQSIAERSEAITTAIQKLDKDDTLLIAGKGHERFQIIGTRHLPFNDKHIALKVIRQLKAS
jgi:UDP-N-acetylmuramyl-tripeptide synthetase